MLYSLRILALKKEEERNSKSINHMGQWHTAFRLHELNFSVVGIIYRIGPQEYPLLVLQSDYKIAKSEFLCHSRCGMKEIPQWPKDITVLTSWHIKSNILTSNMYAIFSDIMQNINNLITCYFLTVTGVACDNFVSQELLDQYLFHMCAKCAIFYSNLIYHGTVDMSKKAAFCNDD